MYVYVSLVQSHTYHTCICIFIYVLHDTYMYMYLIYMYICICIIYKYMYLCVCTWIMFFWKLWCKTPDKTFKKKSPGRALTNFFFNFRCKSLHKFFKKNSHRKRLQDLSLIYILYRYCKAVLLEYLHIIYHASQSWHICNLPMWCYY